MYIYERRKQFMAETIVTEELKAVYSVLDEKKAEDISVLDIGELSTIADYFVIATGMNANHLDALVEAVAETVEKNGWSIRQIEGKGKSGWVLIDCRDIVIHLFDASNRTFYDLARIWKDAKQVNPLEMDA